MISSSQDPAASSKRRRLKKRRRPPPAPPGRLGWLGGGVASMATAGVYGGDGEGDDGAHRGLLGRRGETSTGGAGDDLTDCGDAGGRPRSRERSPDDGLPTPRSDGGAAAAPSSASSAAAVAIDLTGDDDDDDDAFVFRDSPKENGGRYHDGKQSSDAKANGRGGKDGIENNRPIDGRGGGVGVGWPCRRCTLENPTAASSCEACGARRESSRKKRDMAAERNGNDDARGSGPVDARNEMDIPVMEGEKNNQSRGSGLVGGSSAGRSRSKENHKSKETTKDTKRQKKKAPSSKSSKSRGENPQQSIWKWTSSSQSSQQSLSSGLTNIKRSKLSPKYTAGRLHQKNRSTKPNRSRKVDTAMWVDKHAPRSSAELCVAPKKVEEVRDFLESHVSYATRRRSSAKNDSDATTANKPWETPEGLAPEAGLMVLVGSPGVGKSATVRALAREAGARILTWNDVQIDYNKNRRDDAPFEAGSYLPYQSQLSSFEEFLTQGRAGKEALDLGTDLGGADLPSEEGGAREEPGEHGCSLILIEEIPNLWNAEAAQSFRDIMERHVQETQTPTFFIFSDVQEGKHRPEDLERLVPSHVLYSPLVRILPINPVTKSKMKKCLQSIARAEGLLGSSLGRRRAPSFLPEEFFEEAHLTSGGDLRHAIFALQFRCAGRPSTGIGGAGPSRNKESARKDAKLSTFHALGKLLYAKRGPAPRRRDAGTAGVAKWDDGRGPLGFVPEDVLGRIDMGMGPALSFLACHSPDYHTDASDLGRTLGLLSDAAAFADRFGQDDGPFPTEYAACLGGRAVAEGNRRPAPPKFRQLTTPGVFAVTRKARENEGRIDKLRRRLSTCGGGMALLHDDVGSAHQFVTDSLPYMRTIIPQDVNYALANLHSYAKESDGNASNEPPHALEDENKVLMEDDLVDDDDW